MTPTLDQLDNHKLRKEIIRLRVALEPFAKGWWTHQNPNTPVNVCWGDNTYDLRQLCTIGDIHRARKAIANEQEGK